MLKFLIKFAQVFVIGVGFALAWGFVASLLLDSFNPPISPRNYGHDYDEDGQLYLGSEQGTRLWKREGYLSNDQLPKQRRTATVMPPNSRMEYSARPRAPRVVSWRDLDIKAIERPGGNTTYINVGDYYYFVSGREDDAAGYFVVFDGQTKLVKQYVGLSGISESRPANNECFIVNGAPMWNTRNLAPWGNIHEQSPTLPEDNQSNLAAFVQSGQKKDLVPRHIVYLLMSDQSMHRIDLLTGATSPLTDEKVLVVVDDYIYDKEAEKILGTTLLRTPNSIISFRRTGEFEFLRKWPIPDHLVNKQLGIIEIANGNLLMEWNSKDLATEEYVINNTIISPDGDIVETRLDIKRTPGITLLPPQTKTNTVATVPIPILLLLGPYSEAWQYAEFYETSYWQALAATAAKFTSMMITIVLLAIALAILFYVQRRRHGLAVWHIVLILIFGLPAFVSLIWNYPVLKHTAAINQLPQPTGREIFA